MASPTPSDSPLPAETLSVLISPMSIPTFVAEMEKAQRFILRSKTASERSSLLSWDAINALLESDVLLPAGPPPRLQLVRNGTPIAREFWFRAFPQPRIDSAALFGLLRQGATLVVDEIDKAVPALGRLCQDLGVHLDAKTWMNAYLTFGEGAGFNVHFDEHDILVLQVHGAKRWRFYDEREQLPLQELIVRHGMRNRAHATAIAEETLQGGDLLFLPRGEWHSAVNLAPDTPSVHLSVAIRPVRGIDLIQVLRQRALENPLFRRDAPRFSGTLAMQDHEQALKAAIGDLVAQLSLTALRSSDLHGDVRSGIGPSKGKGAENQIPRPPRFNLPALPLAGRNG